MHLVGFIIRIYHDARSSECHIGIKRSCVLCTRVNTVVLYLVTAVHTHLISGFVETDHRTVSDQWAYVVTVSVYFLLKVAQRKGTVPFLSKSTLFLSVENSIRFSTSQEISSILWNLRDHYHLHKSPPLAPILRQEEFSFRPRISFTVCNCVPASERRVDRLYVRSYY